MQHRPIKLGVLGAGNIAMNSGGYLPNLRLMPEKVELVAVADALFERAQAAQRALDIPHAYASLDEMLAQADVEAVLNLTSIPFHGATTLEILQAGKHCVCEKPVATSLEEADAIVEAANKGGLTLVCAPVIAILPLYLEIRRLIREGAIGRVAFARVRSSHGGPASWAFPTDPTWFYQQGSGPLFDMGVYGIHMITSFLGPARRVVAFSGITEPLRQVVAGPFKGKQIEVTADDNTLLMLDFGDSTFAVVDGTYNVNAAKSPRIEIFGRSGTLNLNDVPAVRAGAPRYEVYQVDALGGNGGWITPNETPIERAEERERKLQRAFLVDYFVDCIWNRERPILSGEHARHALEIMLMANESARTGRAIDLTTTF
jgi:predicted dehydrogenase